MIAACSRAAETLLQGAAMESKYLIQTQTGQAFDVSEQQLNDCLYGRDGCQGGWGGVSCGGMLCLIIIKPHLLFALHDCPTVAFAPLISLLAPSPSAVQDVYYYAKATAVCPEGSYGYVSGGYGYSLTCQATACSSQGRIQISGNSKLKAAMAASGYSSTWTSADFNPYVVYVATYTDAFVKIQPSTNAIADVSGHAGMHAGTCG